MPSRKSSKPPTDLSGPQDRGAARQDRVLFLDTNAPPAARDIRDTLVLKEGDLFLVTDLEGNIPIGNRDGLGLYLQDTRFVSGLELAIQGLKPTILLSTGRFHFLGSQVLTNPNLVAATGEQVPEQTIQIRRFRRLQPGVLSEALTFENFNLFPLTLSITLCLEADFADIFEVRGLVQPEENRPATAVEHDGDTVTFFRVGRDGLRREVSLRLDPAPTRVEDGRVFYQLELSARGSAHIGLSARVAATEVGEPAQDRTRRIALASVGRPLAGYRDWLSSQAAIETSNHLFNSMLQQSQHDLRMLMGVLELPETPGAPLPFLAAGLPWYATLFGRDSLITALEQLWLSPSLAEATLRLLARFQGRLDDPSRDEEPGKVMHELRRGELAASGLIPFNPYFGSIDATPLWVMLLGEHHLATGDLRLARELRPALEAALAWIDRYGDRDGDGFVEYLRRSESGLPNQGWKDSWDGIVHADGSLPEPPIALCEVQAYAYAAKRAAAGLFAALGDPERAARLEREAARLRAAFDEAFWMPQGSFYCLALDGRKSQVAAVSSNPGHALWCGIVPDERAGAVAERLLDEDLFSGWGLRTLSSRELRYNPAGYHLGTVWPHDNALCALGLKRYGRADLLLQLATGLFDATQHFPSFRLPELFCGFARSAFGVPVRYPVACSPQAWAAGAWAGLLQAILGLRLDAPAGELYIAQPSLPPWLSWVHVRGISVGQARVELHYERVGEHTAVDVASMRGEVRVTFVERWPERNAVPAGGEREEEHPAGPA